MTPTTLTLLLIVLSATSPTDSIHTLDGAQDLPGVVKSTPIDKFVPTEDIPDVSRQDNPGDESSGKPLHTNIHITPGGGFIYLPHSDKPIYDLYPEPGARSNFDEAGTPVHVLEPSAIGGGYSISRGEVTIERNLTWSDIGINLLIVIMSLAISIALIGAAYSMRNEWRVRSNFVTDLATLLLVGLAMIFMAATAALPDLPSWEPSVHARGWSGCLFLLTALISGIIAASPPKCSPFRD